MLISGIVGIFNAARYFITFSDVIKIGQIAQILRLEYSTYLVLAILYVVLGILAIICGLLTLHHVRPRLALIGSIIGAIAFVPTGMAALLILLLTKNDVLDATGLISES
jgi:hypothetical protein